MPSEGSEWMPARTLLDAVADPLYWIAPDGTVQLVNDAMVEFVGRSREELLGEPAGTFLAEEDVEAVEELIADRLVSGRTDRVRHELQLPGPDGEPRWVEANFSAVVEDGEFKGTVGVVREVTERRERERELAQYETIAETTPVGLFTMDDEAVITWTNGVYPETLGVDREWLVGRPFPELIEAGYYDQATAETYLDTVRDLLSSESDTSRASYQVETHLPDGETLHHEVYTALLPLEEGSFSGTVSAFRDVTTQKRYERELERQNERLDRFASVVSHDLRNPLAVADGYVARAVETGDVDDLEPARDALERMETLVDDLLSLAREGRTVEETTPVDVAALAREAWAGLDTADATLTVADPGRVLADPDRLRQLLDNLFRNSVEWGGVAGRPASGADGSPVAVTVGGLDDGFYVADDGPGISPEDRDRVFDHGYTTSETGTGLGLSIVADIAEAHGWRVAATDAADGGARFEVRGVTAAE